MNAFPKLPTRLLLALLLLSVTASAQDQTLPTMNLEDAAARGNVEQVRLHIARGTELDKPNKRQLTPLAVAAQRGRLEVVKLLADAGASVNSESPFGPPLYQATIRSHPETVAYLLEKGANPDGAEHTGRTALMVAAEAGNKEIVELLVTKGANVNATDNQGRTALSVANRARRDDVADFLRQKGGTEPAVASDRYAYDVGPSSRRSSSHEDQPDILEDPNAIRARLTAFPALVAGLKAADANAASEERGWVSRRTDNRTILIRAVAKQFGEEMLFLKKIATAEGATKTVAAVDELIGKRTQRYDYISSELREVRRLAREEARQANTRGRASGRGSRRRGSREATTTGYDDPMSAEAAGPYGPGRSARPSRRAATEAQPPEPVQDGDTLDQADAWVDADYEDKRDLLETVHELDIYELGEIHAIATEEKANQTIAAIEGLMLARQDRLQRINAKMTAEDERLQRQAERMGAGTRGQTPGMPADATTTTPRRGRRSR